MPYIGTSPSNSVRRVHTYTATASQTTFTGASSEGVTLSYADTNYIDVFQNGVLLGSADYTSTSGTSVVLAQACSESDLIVIIVYDVFSVADTVSKTAGGSFDSAVTMSGGLVIADGGNIGSASDTDAMAISSGGVVNFTQIPTVSSIQLTNAPAFEAQVTSNQAISDNTATKVTFNNEILDTDSKYDHSTNYRFTPTVAGKYFVYLCLSVNALDSSELQNMYAFIYKNGSQYKSAHFNFAGNNARFATASVSAIITFDSDDYIEAYVQCADSAGNAVVNSGSYSTFGAYKMIGIS